MDIRYRRVDQTLPYNHPDCYKDYWIEADGTVVGYVEADRASRSGATISRWMAFNLDGTRLCMHYYTFRALKAEIARVLGAAA